MNKKFSRLLVFAVILTAISFIAIKFMDKADANAQSPELLVKQEGSEFVLSTDEMGEFHRSARQVSDNNLIVLPNSGVRVITWTEREADGRDIPFYALSLDGKNVSRVTEADYRLLIRYGKFDPLVSAPAIAENLRTKTDASEKGAYIVQFKTQPLEDFRQEISRLGGKTFTYLPNHAHIVQMDAETRAKVEALPYVRWVGNYEPAYKLDEQLLAGLANNSLAPARYNIMVLDRGAEMQDKLAAGIRMIGGKVEMTTPEGFRMEATLDANQLLSVAHESDVMFIDQWSAPEADMDVVRDIGGANFIDTTLGYRGQGVRAEVMDGGLRTTHGDFQAGGAPIVHGSVSVDSHGTATYGINFGRGTANPLGKGMLPEAQGIIASYNVFSGGNRYVHTAELKQAPYFAVYQSNSWGNAQTVNYTTLSAEIDDILFINDFCLLNSQSNTGNQTSRPQAWSKNVVSIGGISHFNTASFTDDRWTSASIGPATDGRLKPELAHFYDGIFTTTSTNDTAYTTGFGGTSAATPITAGHFGIFFQMWHQNAFGNNPTGTTVFESRPHMTTAKAVMISTAIQWDMSVANRTRQQQGFGRVDLTNLYNLRNKMLIINETDVLTNTQSRTYNVTVPAGSTDPLKVTMTYNDPMGSPTAMRHRINDLTLKVTAPDGTIYWGNNGLGVGGGMWSTSGGSANVVDTVENVFIQTPAAGNWTIEVSAPELVTDARTETPGVIDADFALVASGIQRATTPAHTRFDYDGDGKADVSVVRPGASSIWYLSRSTAGFASVSFGTTGDRLAPADFDGDGKTDVSVFRPSTGGWYRINSSTNTFVAIGFGTSGDLPRPGDFDGDGKADISVYRPGTSGSWYRINSSTSAFVATAFGTTGDVPLLGDFDGDAKDDIAVFRPGTTAGFYRLNSSTGAFVASSFGTTGDVPVVGDYDGDGKDDIAVYRPGATANWYRINSSTGAFAASAFGIAGDVPTPGDYDGDGKDDIGVFRNGNWYLQRSTAGFSAVAFGSTGDQPTEAAFIQ